MDGNRDQLFSWFPAKIVIPNTKRVIHFVLATTTWVASLKRGYELHAESRGGGLRERISRFT